MNRAGFKNQLRIKIAIGKTISQYGGSAHPFPMAICIFGGDSD